MSSIRTQLDNASKLFDAKKYAQAAELYSAVIAADMTQPAAYSERARCHYQMGHLDQALADLSRAIELSPRRAAYHFTRGRYYLEAGRFHDACNDFSAVLDLERGNEVRRFSKAGAFFRAEANLKLGRYEEALRDCSEIGEDLGLYVLGRMRTRNEIMRDARAGLGESELAK